MTQESQSQEQIYHTSFAHFTVRQKPKCVIEIEAIPTQALLDKAHAKATQAVSKQVSIPGFRKGSAPSPILEKHYAKEIQKEQEGQIARLILQDYDEHYKINPLNKDKVNLTIRKEKEGHFCVKITFETHPTIPSIEISSFALAPIDSPSLTEEQVDEAVRQGLFFFAKWESLDKSVEEGDFVVLDGEIIDEEPAASLFKNTRFEVVDRSMAQWMKALVLGKSTSDVLEGISIPDETLPPKEKELFHPRKMRLTIKKVEKAIMPEITQEFLDQFQMKSFDELRDVTKKQLENKLNQDKQENIRQQAETFLLTKNPFDLPQTFVQHELQYRCSHLDKDPQFMKQWAIFSPQEKQKFIDYLTEQSEKAVKLFQIGQKLLQDKKIHISQEDVLEAIKKKQESFQAANGQPSLEERSEIMSILLLDKTIDYVLTQTSNLEEAR